MSERIDDVTWEAVKREATQRCPGWASHALIDVLALASDPSKVHGQVALVLAEAAVEVGRRSTLDPRAVRTPPGYEPGVGPHSLSWLHEAVDLMRKTVHEDAFSLDEFAIVAQEKFVERYDAALEGLGSVDGGPVSVCGGPVGELVPAYVKNLRMTLAEHHRYGPVVSAEVDLIEAASGNREPRELTVHFREPCVDGGYGPEADLLRQVSTPTGKDGEVKGPPPALKVRFRNDPWKRDRLNLVSVELYEPEEAIDGDG